MSLVHELKADEKDWAKPAKMVSDATLGEKYESEVVRRGGKWGMAMRN